MSGFSSPSGLTLTQESGWVLQEGILYHSMLEYRCEIVHSIMSSAWPR